MAYDMTRLRSDVRERLASLFAGDRAVHVAPSMLSARFDSLGTEVAEIERMGAGVLHLDIMDGHFVPNISYGPGVVAPLRSGSKLPFDVHLMIDHPMEYIASFAKAGADIISFHLEALDDPVKVFDSIEEQGVLPAVAIRPDTDLKELEPHLGRVGMVLVMTVMPGFGGQSFMEGSLERIETVRGWIGSEIALEVDGGLNIATAPGAIQAGANVIVAGTAVFGEDDREAAIQSLRGNHPWGG